jgi:hypothetical protein
MKLMHGVGGSGLGGPGEMWYCITARHAHWSIAACGTKEERHFSAAAQLVNGTFQLLLNF